MPVAAGSPGIARARSPRWPPGAWTGWTPTSRYLPQFVLACVVPFAVLIRVALADRLSGLIIALTLPLMPILAILVGLRTKAVTQRQWRLLARLGGHFLDVVEGLPTLKLFGRGKPQAEVIGTVTGEYRSATLASLDEPTAHLDPDNRRALTTDLLAATAGRSTLLITYDLDGLDQVDEIVVLDHGRVAERGTHAELIRSGGAYRRLWQASLGEYS